MSDPWPEDGWPPLTTPTQCIAYPDTGAGDPASSYDRWTLAPRYGLRPNPWHAAALALHTEFVTRCRDDG